MTKDGEAADIHYWLDEDKIAEEEKYDSLYAICTDWQFISKSAMKKIQKQSKGRE